MGSDTSSSSSGEEDGDAGWRAAIDSVTATTNFSSSAANGASAGSSINQATRKDDTEADNHRPQKLKHYQIKAQKLLDDMVENLIEIVRTENHASHEVPSMDEGGVRLFKCAPPGIEFDHVDELQGPTKKPRILPGEEIDEKSKKFRRQLESIAVNGVDIVAAAKVASQKARARLEAKDAAAKAAAKREEERVAALRKVRGERWLPSIAREMRVKPQR